MSTASFVVLLVAGILGTVLLLAVSIAGWLRHRRRIVTARLSAEIAAETVVRTPEPGSYRGSTAPGYSIVQNAGLIALTRRRLVFHTLTGKVIEVPVTDITGVREAEVFKTAVTPGRRHLVIQIATGEVGFLVSDNRAWVASLADVVGRPLEGGLTARASTGEQDVSGSGLVRKRGGPKGALAVVFISIGLVVGSIAGVDAAVKAQSFSGNHYAEGAVVDFDDSGKGYAPIVEFVPPDGVPIRFTGSLSSDPPAFHVGERVEVRYDPAAPKIAAINKFWHMWFTPVLVGALALPFALSGVVLGALAVVDRRRRQPVGSDAPEA